MSLLQPQRASSRIIVNTAAQYSRSLISIVVALYSTRLILKALGVEDYGIYSLVAGVVAMLSFISNALVSTTQRFLSYHQGKSDIKYLSKLWSNIIVLHLVFAFGLVGVLEIIKPFLFNGFLNIEQDKIQVTGIVYQCSVFMVTISFLSAPFLALLISHENIVYSSVIQIIDSLLRLLIAIAITLFGDNKLILYTYLLCAISIFDICAYSIYTFRKYEECIRPSIKHIERRTLNSIASFLIWQGYSTGCIVGRTQGCAIVLNRFFGTFINTSFGIAQHVSGAISFVSSALLNAINPQIVKAEGVGDRTRMFELAITASKFSFFLLSLVVMPLVASMPIILEFWLGSIPEYSVLFCRVILITALFDQTTIGLGTANSAVGNVRDYALIVNSIKLSTVAILAIALSSGIELYYAIWIYAIMELICACIRIPFLHKYGGLRQGYFIKSVFIALLFPFIILSSGYYIANTLAPNFAIRLLLYGITTIIYMISFYKSSMSISEKTIASGLIKRVLKK